MKRAQITLVRGLLGAAALSVLSPAFAEIGSGQRIVIDGHASGPVFSGIGVVEGGGGTGVLLKDYPEPQRSQILDLVYKPKFGASVSALYVEIPGDGNSTQGSMPSHMHARDDLNYRRGYMWWEMREARARNPKLTLDGAAWSAPGWIGTQGTVWQQNTGAAYQGDAAFFSQDTIDYYVTWLRGLHDVYGLSLSAIGIRNEKGASYDFAKAFRRDLDAKGFADVKLHAFDNWPDWKYDFVRDMPGDAGLRDAVDVIGAHVNTVGGARVPSDVKEIAARLGKPLWNTEQHVYIAGYDGLISTVKSFNDGYIENGFTKIVDWYGIAGLYTMEPYSGEKEAAIRANWPWSGAYHINLKLWAYAHYGQFVEAGWSYLAQGSGRLAGGGSYVTLKSPADDYSIIIETKGAQKQQQVRFETTGMSRSAVAVWRSTSAEQFVRQPDIAPRGGSVAITLEPDAVYSLTTTRGQRKGGFANVPVVAAFPFPYRDTFDLYGAPERRGYLPTYFADIYGAFELTSCPGRTGGCIKQAAPMRPISWAPDWQPYTIVGDDQWRDYEVSVDIFLNPSEAAGIMGRVNDVGTGYGVIPKGYVLRLSSQGQLDLIVVRGKADKKKLIGDDEQQALIRAGKDGGEGGEKLLASATLEGVGTGQWHRLKLRFDGARITGFVDDKPAVTVTDTLYDHGMAGLLAGMDHRRMSMPIYDDFAVGKVNEPLPVPRKMPPVQAPLYPAVD